jgi:hypothetical protein
MESQREQIIHLGFLSETQEKEYLKSEYFPSKVGGKPVRKAFFLFHYSLLQERLGWQKMIYQTHFVLFAKRK